MRLLITHDSRIIALNIFRCTIGFSAFSMGYSPPASFWMLGRSHRIRAGGRTSVSVSPPIVTGEWMLIQWNLWGKFSSNSSHHSIRSRWRTYLHCLRYLCFWKVCANRHHAFRMMVALLSTLLRERANESRELECSSRTTCRHMKLDVIFHSESHGH